MRGHATSPLSPAVSHPPTSPSGSPPSPALPADHPWSRYPPPPAPTAPTPNSTSPSPSSAAALNKSHNQLRLSPTTIPILRPIGRIGAATLYGNEIHFFMFSNGMPQMGPQTESNGRRAWPGRRWWSCGSGSMAVTTSGELMADVTGATSSELMAGVVAE
jgi:hypothetical protein